MPSLADVASVTPTGSDRDAWNAYAEACIMAGKQPLPMAAWIKAGKPAGP